jgi:hypothetical protein
MMTPETQFITICVTRTGMRKTPKKISMTYRLERRLAGTHTCSNGRIPECNLEELGEIIERGEEYESATQRKQSI